MKNMSPILLAGLIAGWFATSAAAQPVAPAAPAPPPAEQSAPPTNSAAPANPTAPANSALPPLPSSRTRISADAISGTADQGLTLNLRNVSVDQALQFLSESAGFSIYRSTSTSFSGTVDVMSETPLNKDEIVSLFNKVLADHGLTIIRDGRTLNVMTAQEASDSAQTPVKIYSPLEPIPADPEMVTEVIPVHTLNPAQVVRDLFSLIPNGAKMNTSDAGNSILMTAPQSDIKRFAQLISALDSTGNGDLQVFLLSYADSKAIAQELKDIFADTGSSTGGVFNPLQAMIGGRGGRGGGLGGLTGGATGSEDARRAAVHVNAVSDDQNNAVLVSAPADYMPGISNIIFKLDIPQEDTVQIRLFFLTNAECTDVADELLALFPDPNQANSTGANNGGRGAAVFGGFGGRGGAAPAPGSTMSDRMKKQVTVNAVADPRTESVLVTASKDTMAQIEQIIIRMDEDPSGHMQVFVYQTQNSDVLDLLGPLTDLFPQENGRTSSASTQQNALLQRQQQAATQTSAMASAGIGNPSVGAASGGGIP